MSIKQRSIKRIEKHKFLNRIVKEHEYRILVTNTFSFILNLLYAFYNGALGIMNGSLWFISMCAYYIVLGVMRFLPYYMGPVTLIRKAL